TTSPAHKLHVSGTGHTGIGVNSGTGVNTYLDFAENGTLRSNIYWNGADDVFVLNSIGANTSINNNGGNVGVGTAAPAYKLHVQTTSSGVDFPLFVRNTSLTSGDGAGIGFVSEPNGNWVKSGIFHERTSVFGIGKLHLLVNNNGDNSSATMVDSRLTIQPDGNVGIGTTGPAAKLDVVGGNVALNNGQLRLRDGADGNHFLQYSNFNGTDGPELVGLSSVKLRQISGGSVGQLVLRNNRVGINTDNPTRGLLEVNGYYNNDANGFYYYANGVCCNSGSGSVDVSIYASRRVQASEFNAFSDARIKNIVGLSNGSEDLKSIMGIEITEYTKIDQAANKGIEKKVIAQQVETVFPQAVSRATDFIPNIYSLANFENGRIEVKNELQSGDLVKLIFEDQTTLSKVEQADENGFTVDVEGSGEVFVYGQQVDDFRTVDYEAIAMLNVSATQELFRIITELQTRNSNLEAKLSDYSSLKNDVELLKEALGIDLQSAK
ncbi:MAG: tail fiber domain-containing protein, partial [Flavobacteriales bacterium]